MEQIFTIVVLLFFCWLAMGNYLLFDQGQAFCLPRFFVRTDYTDLWFWGGGRALFD